MTVQEKLKKLITAENYFSERLNISDDFITFVKDMLPMEYEYIEAKEEEYQTILNFLKEVETDNHGSY